jgi:predicted helicase
MAERRIVEKTGKGIVCFISNYSWLDGLSFTGMRERYLERFDRIWIDCLNGDKYKTGKLTPEGKPDPSIFSTEFNREGIQVGTAISVLVRREKPAGTQTVRFRHLWGKEKRAQLLEDAERDVTPDYEKKLTPALELGLPFQLGAVTTGYLSCPLLPELFPVSFPGVKTSRDDVVVDIDKERLISRMKSYFDPDLSDGEIRALMPTAMTNTGGFDARTRRYLIERGFKPKNVTRYCYRPFDNRWIYLGT